MFLGRRRIPAAALAALALAPGTAIAGQTVEDFETAQQAAWNAHDAAAYTAAFAPDADVISALGWHWAGQAAAAQNIGDGFKFVYAKARIAFSEVRAKVLTPDLTLVTLGWSIDGARTFDTGQPAGVQRGIETQLLAQRGDGWAIVSQQDTLSAGSAPTPESPALAPAEKATAPATAFPTTPPPVRRCIVARKDGGCVIYGKARPAKTD